MSSEREYESEAPGAPGAGAASPLSSFPPPVYHPRPGPAPAYEEYADPAAAHGWQNAYDETRELPPITEFGPVGTEGPGAPRDPGGVAASRVSGVGVPIGYGPAGPGAPGIGVDGGPSPALGAGRAERRRREQRRRDGRRRLAAVAGALGVAGAVALIAGVTGSGSPAESRHKGSGRADATASAGTDDAGAATSAAPSVTDPAPDSAPVKSPAPGSAASAPAAPPVAAVKATSPRPTPTTASAPPPTTAGAPSPAPTATTPTPYFPSGGRGHGHGRYPR